VICRCKVELTDQSSCVDTYRTHITHQQDGPDGSLGQPGSHPVIIVLDGVVESDDRNLDTLDLEEGFPVNIIRVLEGDVERDSLGSELNVQQPRVFESDPTGLFVEPVGNVGSLDVKTFDSETSGAVVVRGVCEGRSRHGQLRHASGKRTNKMSSQAAYP
jgi:hypothetical protein